MQANDIGSREQTVEVGLHFVLVGFRERVHHDNLGAKCRRRLSRAAADAAEADDADGSLQDAGRDRRQSCECVVRGRLSRVRRRAVSDKEKAFLAEVCKAAGEG
jgi:hypothetical protein